MGDIQRRILHSGFYSECITWVCRKVLPVVRMDHQDRQFESLYISNHGLELRMDRSCS